MTETDNICEPIEPPLGGLPIPNPHRGYQHVTNTVTDPLNRATVHYFAAWNADVVSTDDNFERDFGLPFTRETTAIGAPGPRYLSQEVCSAGGDPCDVLRTTYLKYDDAAPSWAYRSAVSMGRKAMVHIAAVRERSVLVSRRRRVLFI